MSSASSYTPRKKKRRGVQTHIRSDLFEVDESFKPARPAFPLAAFLWPARGTTSQWVILPLILMIVGLFRWTTGLWGYSGQGKPPLFGDYEAQRHWMEITNHLPISMWYFHDLQYWGLDYPPLTAYHSWAMGKFGSFIDQDWFALNTSRGMENQPLKVYMRATVLFSEYLVYIPALVIFLRKYGRTQGVGGLGVSCASIAVLMQPATILIDHGHFQYNTVMLGFVVASMASVFSGNLLWCCVFFVAALGFKQMALYYSPVMFAFLFGSCITPQIKPFRLVAVTATTLLAFAILFAPLLLGSLYDQYREPTLDLELTPPDIFINLLTKLPVAISSKSLLYPQILQITQSIHRIFPFARGLFEDKVANFWCFLHTFYKLHSVNPVFLRRLSLYFTLLSILAPCMIVGAVPRRSILPYALATSAWGFYLFSFQVHEKSVLLPLLPMTLLFGSAAGFSREYRVWIGWANVLGTWTMYPLLKRDGLATPYAVLTLLWTYLIGIPPTSIDLYSYSPGKGRGQADGVYFSTTVLHSTFYISMMVWHMLELFVPPPSNKPDLYPVINALLGAMGFGICYLWCLWKLVWHSGLLGDYLMDQQARVKKTY